MIMDRVRISPNTSDLMLSVSRVSQLCVTCVTGSGHLCRYTQLNTSNVRVLYTHLGKRGPILFFLSIFLSHVVSHVGVMLCRSHAVSQFDMSHAVPTLV